MNELTPQAANMLLDLISNATDEANECAQSQYDTPGPDGPPEQADAPTFLADVVTYLSEVAGTSAEG